jgi:hypothetical protein
VDAAAAAADDATADDADPSVEDIPADGRRRPGSQSPTPPVEAFHVEASQDRLIDQLAIRAARGEPPPGIEDGDELREGRTDYDAENNLNVAAVAASERTPPPP